MPITPDLSSFNYFETLFHNTVQNTVLLMDKEGVIIAVNKPFQIALVTNPMTSLGKM
jgi:hypothetical protein